MASTVRPARLRSMFRYLALVLMPSSSLAQQTLAGLEDTKRVVLVFAPSDHDPRFLQQLKMLARHAKEMRERQLVLIPVVIQSSVQVNSETLPGISSARLSEDEQSVARESFGVTPGAFVALLLGKDGGEKLRRSVPISMDQLNRTIDAMPMRKQEMRK